ncbi:hypothetical protein B0H13DRAFT_2329880 [Mycena leptocephala]|nr:hypothetical protein B0H13DRAFT_2329880 [Mycena leptocephala]
MLGDSYVPFLSGFELPQTNSVHVIRGKEIPMQGWRVRGPGVGCMGYELYDALNDDTALAGHGHELPDPALSAIARHATNGTAPTQQTHRVTSPLTPGMATSCPSPLSLRRELSWLRAIATGKCLPRVWSRARARRRKATIWWPPPQRLPFSDVRAALEEQPGSHYRRFLLPGRMSVESSMHSKQRTKDYPTVRHRFLRSGLRSVAFLARTATSDSDREVSPFFYLNSLYMS